MTRTKYVLFALLTSTIVVVVAGTGLLAADIYYHHKFLTSAGLNVWGYRGPTVGRKKNGERRVVVLGESQTFGYGVRWQETIPAYLQEFLNRDSSGRPVTVVNLGANGDGAHSYSYTLEDYSYLNYDAVVFYSGYSDLVGYNPGVMRHASPVFRLTGYFPILPLIFREKSMSIMYGGNLEQAYKGQKTVFRPDVVQRTAASALGAAANVSESIDKQFADPEPAADKEAAMREGDACGPQWAYYCGGMYRAVKYALDRQKAVMIVTQPYLNDKHVGQQDGLVAFLRNRFSNQPSLRFANLGKALSLKDPALSWDGMHLTAAGNRLIADRLAAPVADMIR